MGLSFTIHEHMQGFHHFTDRSIGDPRDRPCYFELDWGGPLPERIEPSSPQFFRFEASGKIFFSGMTDEPVPCNGSLELDYFEAHRLTYQLDFESAGSRYHFEGVKIDVELWRPWRLLRTHTTCYGEVVREDGLTVSRSVLHFPLKELVPFVASFRLHWD